MLFPDFVTFTLSPFCFSFSFLSGDRSSFGSASSVGSTRSAGSGQSSESSHKQSGTQNRHNADISKVTLYVQLHMGWSSINTPYQPPNAFSAGYEVSSSTNYMLCFIRMRTTRLTKLPCCILSAVYCNNPRDWSFSFPRRWLPLLVNQETISIQQQQTTINRRMQQRVRILSL